MDQIKTYADERHAEFCAFCGNVPETADHAPSKVLLDEPYPTNLAVVGACEQCNNGFSKDEEYLACALESVCTGTTDPDQVTRPKVARILRDKPTLRAAIEASRSTDSSGTILWNLDLARVENIILKLARGHAAFEGAEPQLDPPSTIFFRPFSQMTESQRLAFEVVPQGAGWPEIGSRAFFKAANALGTDSDAENWEVVQAGRYRYVASFGGEIVIRMVLSEYLACQVIWS